MSISEKQSFMMPEGVHFNSGSQMYTVSDLTALD